MAHEDDLIEILPFDLVDDVVDVCCHVNLVVQEMRALAETGERRRKDTVPFRSQAVHNALPTPSAMHHAPERMSPACVAANSRWQAQCWIPPQPPARRPRGLGDATGDQDQMSLGPSMIRRTEGCVAASHAQETNQTPHGFPCVVVVTWGFARYAGESAGHASAPLR